MKLGKNSRANRPEPVPMEVWNANLYFDDKSGAKNRPVIVLEKRDTKYTVLMVTTHGRNANTDFKLLDPYEVMLDKTSTVRGDRLFQIPFSKFNYKLGTLCPEDREIMDDVFDRLKDSRAYRRGDYRGIPWPTVSRLPGRSSPHLTQSSAST